MGQRAEATPIFFNFALDFDSGPLDGQSFLGALSVDGNDCPGSCNGLFTPDGVDGDLLSFDVTVSGIAFSITNDTVFPFKPEVQFANNTIAFVDSVLEIGAGTELDILFGTLDEPDVIFTLAAGEASIGQFRQVPEPTGFALFAAGLAVLLGVVAQRRRSIIDNPWC
jgi:hypothetical protein